MGDSSVVSPILAGLQRVGTEADEGISAILSHNTVSRFAHLDITNGAH